MKRTQIMIIFVAVVFAGVCWAQNNDSLHGNGSDITAMTVQPVTITTATVHTKAPVTISEATTHSGPKTTAANMDSNVTGINTTSSRSFTTSSITTVATTSPYFVTTNSTPAAHEDTTYVSPSPCGGFDGASFIGGIVLALGVIVILVIIVKCYNHQSNKNELHYSQF